MPTIEFKGKQFVYSHHHTLPFRELVVDEEKSLPATNKKANLDDNLIIHGDNLHALKALMPRYAGKVKCIYIDPPYNTGNEGWVYNDNVNSPLMREWLKNVKPVDREDMERHDKWLCMMYPRLKLLHELLADDGVIFISIDDNEVHHLRMLMDEVFGESGVRTTVIWQKSNKPLNRSNDGFSSNTEYVLVYCKSEEPLKLNSDPVSEEHLKSYKNPDNDPRGKWIQTPLFLRTNSNKEKELILPWNNEGRTEKWFVSQTTLNDLWKDSRIWRGKEGNSEVIYKKNFLSEKEEDGMTPINFLSPEKVGFSRNGAELLREIFDNDNNFQTPKPETLIKYLIGKVSDKSSIILDSFAGSGTTAHAVLDLNKEDGGNRKFILVECEDYADSITAERVRRVIKGVPTAKDEKLKNGLGGSFTFCELGQAMEIEKMLTGESLPSYENLASYVFYTSTGKSLESPAKSRSDFFVGETDLFEIYLIYKPDLAFLRSNESALNFEKVETIKSRSASKKTKLVFATAKFMGQKELNESQITFCQLPYSIHKIAGK